MTACTERSEGQNGRPGRLEPEVLERPQVERVARGGLANMAGSALAGGTGVAVTWIVARALGAEQAGAFFAATAAFVLAGGLAKLGTQTGLVYWPARLRATGRDHLLGACLRAGLAPVAGLSLLLAVAMWLAAPTIARVTAHDATGLIGTHTAGLRVLAVFLPLQAMTDALLTATRGYRAMRPTVLLDRVLRSALQLLAVGAAGAAALWTTASLPVLALAWAAPYLPVTVLAAFAVRKVYRAGKPPGVTTGRAERSEVRRAFWRFTARRPGAEHRVFRSVLQRLGLLHQRQPETARHHRRRAYRAAVGLTRRVPRYCCQSSLVATARHGRHGSAR